MIFSSLAFIIFFLFFLVAIRYLNKHQKILIILFSLFFYAYWNPIFIFIILYLCLITYICYKNKYSVSISSFLIVLPLIYFKYSYFIFINLGFSENLFLIYDGELPLAISFITFTAIAFIIDIKKKLYRENVDFLSFLEFIVYFPQLIAGPILRANQLIPQLKNKIIFKSDNIKFGLVLFTIGFIKKVYFADTIANVIDPIFLNPNEVPNTYLIKGFLLFPLQIYLDFSGYIDMALGISLIFSIMLPVNFDKPYLSKSLTEFWRNWHITLSNWFKDYIYIPLGGSRSGNFIIFRNLIITMSLAGFWHGANFNFILWGFLNGFMLFFEKKISIFKNFNNTSRIFINCFLVFNLWLVFRIQDFNILLDYIILLYSNFYNIFYLSNLIIFLFTILAIYLQKFDNYYFLKNITKKIDLKYFLPIAIILIISGLSFAAGKSDKFIYFNF